QKAASSLTLQQCLHLSTVHVEVEGDIKFPIMPENFNLVFEQFFMSNINYTYQIWKKG
ncbi:TPA: trimethoprim-resistant dihydrofolate reductase DfrA1, partial [Escherichia coli]|nr:trimethoprim-resistant dihydrofolate reductase DfrA1 [Escherichia coli]